MATVDTVPIPPSPTSFQNRAPNLYTLNGAFLTILRRHFAQQDNLEVPEMRHYSWDQDDKVSKILIEPVYRWNPQNIQQRPAVIVKRGPWKLVQLGIGSRQQGLPELNGFVEDKHSVGVLGTHSFFCMGTVGLEAEEVAQEVVNCLMCFLQVIRQQFCLTRFFVTDIGPCSKIDECQDHFATPVNVEYSLQWNWNLIRQAPVWARSDSLTFE